MSGPVIPRNIAQEVNKSLADGNGWEFFKQQFLPAVVADTFRPDDQLLVDIAHFSTTSFGAKFLEWLHDLTDRAPYPIDGATIEAAALAAARHQGRAGVGHVLTKAVTEGRRLQNQNKG